MEAHHTKFAGPREITDTSQQNPVWEIKKKKNNSDLDCSTTALLAFAAIRFIPRCHHARISDIHKYDRATVMCWITLEKTTETPRQEAA